VIEEIQTIVAAARNDGRDILLETEGLQILRAMGIPTPHHDVVKDTVSTLELSDFTGEKVVIKVVSPDILHKSDVGGVVIASREHEAIADSIVRMQKGLQGRDVRGFLVSEYVPYDPSLGGELLFGARWTDDFGVVVTYSAGGIYTDVLARYFKEGAGAAVASTAGLDRATAEKAVRRVAVTSLVTGQLRGQTPRIGLIELVDMFMRFAGLANAVVPEYLSEIEVNPFVISRGRLLALDVLAKCGTRTRPELTERPVHKIRNLLEPRTIAIVGVSERMNPGRIILNNLIRDGFDKQRIFIVKPGSDAIEGVTCHPDIRSLPQKVDLLILAIAAAQIPEALSDVVDEEKAESIIVITGGLEEKEGTEDITSAMRSTLERARDSEWRGPVINGGNSMGIRSQPGGYDTTFIPQYKLPKPEAPTYPVAFISQSGAFAVAKTSKLGFHSRYVISIGNQMDLTIGDYLEYLKDDPQLELFVVYAEGFRPLDGLKFIEAARQITSRGKTVILYRASRTQEGAQASASHTAAVAGDYVVTRELARQAGVLVCETTEDFEDLVRLFTLLAPKQVTGRRLAAISNAGFECVAMADHLESFRLAELSERTTVSLSSHFARFRLDQVVDVRNPLDLTPIMTDAPYEEAVRTMMEDENVDVGLVSCVPLTGALHTLPPGELHNEDVGHEESIAWRLIRLKDEISKPWVAAVDGGSMFDPLAMLLEENGVPTFRTVERALRLFSRYCDARINRA
jgi:acyl-CoA synthetase (NDP forming)